MSQETQEDAVEQEMAAEREEPQEEEEQMEEKEASKAPTDTDVKPLTIPINATEASDLTKPRRIWIVTTAALPWRTGTAVNPLLRALYLVRYGHTVTLLLPWLENKHQESLYGRQTTFANQADQQEWIRQYCVDRCGATHTQAQQLHIQFWHGVYHAGFGSIFPTQDIASLVPVDQADVAILEEPEHLNWWRSPPASGDDGAYWGWAARFTHVIGILHTNYDAYMKQYQATSLITAPALHALSALTIRAYCHQVIRLSSTLPSYEARIEVTSNVHGVRHEFFQEAAHNNNNEEEEEDADATAAVYFIGKLIWAKGFDQVLELQELYRTAKGSYFDMDIYGGGEDAKAIKLAFFGRRKRRVAAEVASSSSSSSSEEDEDSDVNDQDKAAASVFGATASLREQIQDAPVGAPPQQQDEKLEVDAGDILKNLSGQTLQTGAEVAGEAASAALKVIESVVEQGLGAFSHDESAEYEKAAKSHEQGSPKKAKKFHLAPPRSRFKWRKTPLPARFLGVKDHIDLRQLRAQKIFLNMSTSEVLCTTTAEALAMGKFVILPKHRKLLLDVVV